MPKKTDSLIEQWVLRELRSDASIRSQEICVHSRDGVVTLNGSVQNFANLQAAEQAALRVDGVTGVVNDINLKPLFAEENKTSAILVLLRQPNVGGLVTYKPDEWLAAKAMAR